MKIRLVCEKCGRDFKPDMYTTKHRGGNITAAVMNYKENEDCVYCEHPELFEKKKEE